MPDFKNCTSISLIFLFFLTVGIPAFSTDEISIVELSNGLRLFMLEDHSSPVVSLRIFYQAGVKNEPPGMSGMTSLCSWLINEGTSDLNREDFARIIQAGGGRSTYANYMDYAEFAVKVPSNMLDTVLFLQAHRMRNVEFSYERLLMAKDAIRKRRLHNIDNRIYGYINEEFLNLSYRSHPYQNPVLGWPGDVDRISLDNLKKYYQAYFSPSNAVMVVAGDFQTEWLSSNVKRLFGNIYSGERPESQKIVDPKQVGERRSNLPGKSNLGALIVGYHIPEFIHPDRPVLQIISSILAEGTSSRLFRRMVTREKTALGVGGGLLEARDPGLIYAWAVMNYDIPVSIGEEQLLSEIDLIVDELVTDRELEAAKNQIEAEYYRSINALDRKARVIGYSEMMGGNWKMMQEFIRAARAVSKEDVLETARKYFNEVNRNVIILHALNEADESYDED